MTGLTDQGKRLPQLPERSDFGVSFSSGQPCWTQPRLYSSICVMGILVLYVSERFCAFMSICEALGEAINRVHVLEGSSILIYSWSYSLDVDHMAACMTGLGHSDLSPELSAGPLIM